MKAMLSRWTWTFVNWWLQRAGRVAVPVAGLVAADEATKKMAGHLERSGHLARVYHVRWTLEMALTDLRATLAKLRGPADA